MSGQTFSHYRILEPLGEGGMGIVYRAEDTQLGRLVALKFLHPWALDQQTLRIRFLREARLAASVNHPNVCTIFEVGEVPAGAGFVADGGSQESFPPGTPFIAMELVGGQTLHDVLARAGRLPIKELLNTAVQIAEGMQEAHARNIVHRDLKPQNVVVGPTGQVKILDFGLAKPLDRARADDSVMVDAQTQSAELTRAGNIVGTVAYMSPEQAQGKALDSRSDLFSFGTMLYELATGKRPFDGETPTATVAKVLESDPRPLSDVAPHLPADLDRIVRRCLQKNPADRYHDTRDLVLDLKALQQTVSSGVVVKGTSSARPSRRAVVAGVLVGTVILAVVGLGLFKWPRAAPSVAPMTHRQITFTGDVSAPAVSPDGKFVAYVTGPWAGSEQKVVVQELAGGQGLEVYRGRSIPGDLRWSPDGSEVVFGAGIPGGTFNRAAFLVPRLGGTPRQLPAPSMYLSWSPDGDRLATANSTSKAIVVLNKSTGQTTDVQLGGSFAFVFGVDWSPAGNLLAVATTTGEERSTLLTIKVNGTDERKIVDEKTEVRSPRWSAAGDAIYYLRGTSSTSLELWKVPVARDTGQPLGPAALVLGGLPFGGTFTLARDGKMAYLRTPRAQNLWLVTIKESGTGPQVTQLTAGTFADTRPALSPEGTRIAFSRRTGDKSNIFVVPLEGGSPQQLTFLTSAEGPSWSPDGKEVAFNSAESGSPRIWRASAAGGPPRMFGKTQATVGDGGGGPLLAWAPDGRTILYQRPGNRNLHALDPATEHEVPLVRNGSVSGIFAPSYSPDGSHVAFYWNRSPEAGISVVSSADFSETKVFDGFAYPAGWSRDGKWLYITEGTSPARLVATPANGGSSRVLAALPWPFIGTSGNLQCTTADGRRFVCAVPQSSSDAWIVQNFDPDVR